MPIDTTITAPTPEPNTPPVADPPNIAENSFPVLAPAATPAAPQPAAPPVQPAPQSHHGVMASIFQDLAGGKKTVWNQTPDGPVASKVDLKPGEMARGILAAAITGLASGYAPGARGTGAGGAAAAGFIGNQERTDANAKEAKAQAESQFQNKNIADELTMRKMQSAMEQQRSIRDAQKHDQDMLESAQRLKSGDFTYSQAILKSDQEQTDRYNILRKLGGTPLVDQTGNVVPEFNSGADAQKFANENPKLASKKGDYYNQIEIDPATHRWIIMSVPKTWDDPKWLHVLTDKEGNPVRDKEGNLQPDPNNPLKVDGKTTVPAGPMTPHQSYDMQVMGLGIQTKQIELEDAKVRLANAELGYKKDQRIAKAEEEFNKANGDPLSIDPKTHEYIMAPSSRGILSDEYVKKGALYNSVFEGANKKLEEIGGEPKANAPQSEKDAYNELVRTRNDAYQNMHDLQVKMMQLNNVPNIADTIADQLYKENQKPDNSPIDVDKAIDSLGDIASGLKQSIREKLTQKTAGAPSSDTLTTPEALSNAVAFSAQRINSGQPVEAEIAAIQGATSFSKTDKERLIDALRKLPAKAPGAKNLHEYFQAHPAADPIAPPAAMQGMSR